MPILANLIADLQNAGIIHADFAEQLRTELSADVSSDTLLYKLLSQFSGKAYPQNDDDGFTVTLYQEELSYSDQPNKLLDILFLHQVIDNRIYERLKARTIPNTPGGNTIILHQAGELIFYYKSFTTEQQLAFAATLFGHRKPVDYSGILQQEDYDKLKADILLGKLSSYLDFFDYSYNCRRLQVSQNLTAQQVLDLAMPLLNKLLYNSFSIKNITISEHEYHGHPSYEDRLVTLTLDTGFQHHRYSYTCMRNTQNRQIRNQQVLEHLLLFMNDLLADFAAPHRFTAITSLMRSNLFPGQEDDVVICSLVRQQQSVFDFYDLRRHSLFNQPLLTFRDVLSYRRIEYITHHFKTCGILDHLDEHEISEVISSLQEKTYENADQLLSAFPGTTTVVNRYPTPNQPPYLQLLPALGAMSNGLLNFTDIEDHTPTTALIGYEGNYTIRFKCNGIQHQFENQHYYGEFNQGVLFYLGREILHTGFPEFVLLRIIIRGIEQEAYSLVSRKQLDYLADAKIELGMNIS